MKVSALRSESGDWREVLRVQGYDPQIVEGTLSSSNKPRLAQPEEFCSLIGTQLSTVPTRNDDFRGDEEESSTGLLSGCSATSIRSLALLSKNPLYLRRWRRDGVGQGLGPGRIERVCQSRSPPKFERDRQRIDADPRPPRGFIAVTMKIPMVQPADWDCVFVADLSAESTGLSEPNVMGLGWRAAAHRAWLGRDELAVLLVAQANGFRRNATAPGASVIRGNWRLDCDCVFNRSDKWLPNRRFRIFRRCRLQSFLTSGGRHLNR